jgi:CLASP N terminal
MLTQLSDLRSAVCKEAFKTVALIAMVLGQSFNTLSEYWVPAIIKQVAVKIQVISVSADHSIRIIVSSTVIGYSKLVSVFTDQINGKNPILRKHCIEYLSLAASLWSQDILDK